MIIKHKSRSYLILIVFIGMFNNVWGQEADHSLEWDIETDKATFYPGEPVLLTLNIRNNGLQEEKVDFGPDGIGAFSLKVYDSNDILVSEGGKIHKSGILRVGTLLILSGNTCRKTIVLNRWCSTLQRPGRYHIMCSVEYRLYSEFQRLPDPNNIVLKAGPLHKKQLELDIQIIEMDKTKFKETLESLVAFEAKSESQNKGEWLKERDIKREMLALTESELAVPYQLQLLKTDPYTWFGPDAVNSLVRSGTLLVTIGLVQLVEDPSYNGEVKPILIDGIYRLRDKGKPAILNATDEFTAKYKRPIIGQPID
jgi:hypothetical protein